MPLRSANVAAPSACSEFFFPDYRNGYHQRYCASRDCRQASKAVSQQRWLRQTANRDYFRGSHQVRRVQEWRKAHPGYWKRKSSSPARPQVAQSQVSKPEQSSCNAPSSPLGTLQDFCLSQQPVFVGLISMFTGSTLQEDIVVTTRQLLDRGRNILGLMLSESPNATKPKPCPDYDHQTSPPTGSCAADPPEL